MSSQASMSAKPNYSAQKNWRESILQNHAELCNLTKVSAEFLIRCSAHLIITKEEHERIVSETTAIGKAQAFYYIILKKDKADFERFLEITSEFGNGENEDALKILRGESDKSQNLSTEYYQEVKGTGSAFLYDEMESRKRLSNPDHGDWRQIIRSNIIKLNEYTTITPRLLDSCFQECVLTMDEREMIKCNRTEYERARAFYNLVLNKDKNTVETLIKIMNDRDNHQDNPQYSFVLFILERALASGYPDYPVFGRLNRTTDNFPKSQNMSSTSKRKDNEITKTENLTYLDDAGDWRNTVRSNFDTLCNHTLITHRLIDKCYESGVMTSDAMDLLEARQTEYERARDFYKFVLRKNTPTLEILIKIMSEPETRQPDLVLKILKTALASSKSWVDSHSRRSVESNLIKVLSPTNTFELWDLCCRYNILAQSELADINCDELPSHDMLCFLFAGVLNLDDKDFKHFLKILSESDNQLSKALFEELSDKQIITSIGFPVAFEILEPIPSFVGRTSELLELQKLLENACSSRITCISGLGGIGKTELARKYISEKTCQSLYQNIIWINGPEIENSFQRLARQMNLEWIDLEKSSKTCLEHCSHQKSLIVFDDVGDGIEHFLLRVLPLSSTNLDVLLTSRRFLIDQKTKELRLENLRPQDASKLVQIGLKLKNSNDCAQIAARLDHLPLGLQQTISYILYTSSSSSKNDSPIAEYLSLVDSEEAIRFDHSSWSGNAYSRTIFNTWSPTIEHIASNERYGDLAQKFLIMMAYLDPENIKSTMIFDSSDDVKRVRASLNLLGEYSMIEAKGPNICIHPLVQRTIRMQCTKLGIQFNIMKECLESVPSKYLVEHVTAIREHVVKYYDVISKVRVVLQDRVQDLSSSAKALVQILEGIAGELDVNKKWRQFGIVLGFHQSVLDEIRMNTQLTNEIRFREVIERSRRVLVDASIPELIKLLMRIGHGDEDESDSNLEHQLELLEKLTLFNVEHRSQTDLRSVYDLSFILNVLGEDRKQREFLKKIEQILKASQYYDDLSLTRTLTSLANAGGGDW